MHASFNILIVEDELNLGTTLSEYLNDKSHHVKWAKSCKEAKSHFTTSHYHPDVVLMDIGLPDGDGVELAKELRHMRKDFVLIFLSAQNDPDIKYQSLEMGAEDYMTKPFDLRELMLRLNKAIKINDSLKFYQDEIQLSNLKIKFKSYEAIDAQGKVISLGQKECAILELLYSRKNEVVSRDTMIDLIWGENAYPTNRTVDNYIVKLRKWIETDKTGHISIKSVRGIGYQLAIKQGINHA